MINIRSLDEGGKLLGDDKELLSLQQDTVRDYYSRTGPVRADYIGPMAEAEAKTIKVVLQAQADGLLAIRTAEAQGYKIVGEALEQCEHRDLVVKLVALMTLQEVSRSLADGKATKMFLPQNIGDIFSLIAGWKEVQETPVSTS
jgi:hypothetical protein